jgi:hypothetical protein
MGQLLISKPLLLGKILSPTRNLERHFEIWSLSLQQWGLFERVTTSCRSSISNQVRHGWRRNQRLQRAIRLLIKATVFWMRSCFSMVRWIPIAGRRCSRDNTVESKWHSQTTIHETRLTLTEQSSNRCLNFLEASEILVSLFRVIGFLSSPQFGCLTDLQIS